MRRIGFLAVAAAALVLTASQQAQAGGRRTRYYSYGGSSYSGAAVTQRATGAANTAQSNTIRRYSYSPTTGSTSYSYGGSRPVMGSTPYNTNFYWRADRKVMGY